MKKWRRSFIRKLILGREQDHPRETPSLQNQTDAPDNFQRVFPIRRQNSMSSLQSFVHFPLTQDTGIGIASGTPDEKSTFKAPPPGGGQSHFHHHHHHGHHDGDTHSIGSRHSAGTLQGKPRHKHNITRASTDASGRAHVYAGVTHSDLDIQDTRPPLMFQMDIIEWLWSQSTNKHRFILMIIALLFFLAIANIVFGLVIFFQEVDPGNPYICKTKACRALGKRILSKLNRSVDPCENFYAFVCGSSGIDEDASQEKRDKWTFGYYGGRIVYDFHKSIRLGKMFKKAKKFPENQLIPYYKSCLDVVGREEDGLEPFYETLRKFGLYDVSKNNPHTADQVIHAMVYILAHGYKVSAIIRDILYYDTKHKRVNLVFSASIPLMSAYPTGKVTVYGYETYRDTVKNAFTLLSELNVPTDELDILAHDIVCIELRLRDREMGVGGDAMKALKGEAATSGLTCDAINGSAIPGNFGKNPDGNFNYTLFAIKMHELVDPDATTEKLPVITSSPSAGNQRFLDDFETFFNHSAPYRLLRYLQWRLFFSVSSDLNEAAINVMLPVKRHFFLGVPYCIQRLFNKMPFVAPERFMESYSKEDVEKLFTEFQALMDMIETVYYKAVTRSKYKELQAYLGRDLSDREFRLLRKIMVATMRTDDVPPVVYDVKSKDKIKAFALSLSYLLRTPFTKYSTYISIKLKEP